MGGLYRKVGCFPAWLILFWLGNELVQTYTVYCNIQYAYGGSIYEAGSFRFHISGRKCDAGKFRQLTFARVVELEGLRLGM